MTVSLDTLVESFLEAARRIQAQPEIHADDIIDYIVHSYRSMRVGGESFDRRWDMILIQWGNYPAIDVREPADLRSHTGDSSVTMTPERYRTFDITRTIFARSNDPARHDDLTLQLSLSLLYGPGEGHVTFAHLPLSFPESVEEDIKTNLNRSRADPFVAQLLTLPAQRLVATVRFLTADELSYKPAPEGGAEGLHHGPHREETRTQSVLYGLITFGPAIIAIIYGPAAGIVAIVAAIIALYLYARWRDRHGYYPIYSVTPQAIIWQLTFVISILVLIFRLWHAR